MLDDVKVWGYMGLTILVKLLLSPGQSLGRASATASSGVLAALVLTDPTIHWLGVERDAYQIMIVCFWTLAGENFIRRVLEITENTDLLLSIIDRFRGTK